MEKWTLYQFFRFLTQQSITEHLDLSTFIKPTQSLKINALSLSAEEVHHLVTQLLTHSLSPMQALFASVSALLSYYGALRRGELLRLRLRLQDIRCTHEKVSYLRSTLPIPRKAKQKAETRARFRL
ncbi:hypothetical protein QWY96_05170 [Vibrio artabrorum]|uniref:Tyr recombinase domain-containing protein n=2 Tax=Vibrio artabrorum TaxID=446374 RepID=A0ABT8CIN9_9VIBR|nr:hypothetical protein [Vibrio artabrorum]MDN3700424.1 hypothetical protein [Vibrio artabrorum]